MHNIVSERVLHKRESAFSDLCNELGFLGIRGMVDAALENAAAMPMSTDHNAVRSNSIENELCISGGEVIKTFLNNMIAIQVLD